jgi:hypothetical protein
MSCNFIDAVSAVPGNFVCKRCTVCNHVVNMPAKLAASNWPVLLTQITQNCPHNAGNKTAVVPAPFTPTDQIAPVSVPPVELPPQEPVDVLEDPTKNLPDPFNAPEPPMGAGGFLKKYLSRIGITSTPNCSCNAKAKHMDTMGVEWCEQNLDTIVMWLKEEAERRHLPFIEWPTRLLVKKAISSAKKAAAKK